MPATSLPYPSQPATSALQTLLATPPTSSQENNHAIHQVHLALQTAHNLRYQHSWSGLRIHQPQNSSSSPRPVLSGLPPRRLYVHPDEQIELLQSHQAAGRTGMPDVRAEREWVLPSHVREKWTLRVMGEVFDSVGAVPGLGEGEGVYDDEDDDGKGGEQAQENKWRTTQPKRVLMAVVDDDSTIAYYIVHDGLVKPRQN